MQAAGIASFYARANADALPALDRACLLGVKSRLFDPLVLALLAFLRFDARDGKGLTQAHEHLGRAIERSPESAKVQRLARVVAGLRLAHERRHPEALEAVCALSAEVEAPDFDMDTACALTGLWTRLDSQHAPRDAMAQAIQRIAERFCVSRASCEILVAAANGVDAVVEIIQAAHTAVSAWAERAMGHSLKGEPRLAVQLLLEEGERTRNAKLIEMAGLVAQRHHEKIDDAAALSAQAKVLKQRYAGAIASFGARQGGRSAGGLTLRTSG